MNDAQQLELVDLGDAKAVTQGIPALVNTEDHPWFDRRPED
jgi:Family of unknown function (DUF5974)